MENSEGSNNTALYEQMYRDVFGSDVEASSGGEGPRGSVVGMCSYSTLSSSCVQYKLFFRDCPAADPPPPPPP